MSYSEQVEKYLAQKAEGEKEYLRTGCLVLDLCVGGGMGLGFPSGKIVNLVGDKSAGKTFLANEIIAANFHRLGKRLRWNFDDGEDGYSFDTRRLYRMDIVTEESLRSDTVEQWDVNLARFLRTMKDGQTGIYVLDSLDGISNEDMEDRAEARLKAADAGKEFKDGTYGTKTAKFLSQELFRTKASLISKTGTLLVIVSQVRENMEGGAYSPKFKRSGGKALDHYCHSVLWLSTLSKIVVNDRAVGVVVRARLEKSKTPRPFRECTFSLYFDYGIDDIGTSLDYLFDLRGKDHKLLKAAEAVNWSGAPCTLDALTAFLEESGKDLKELRSLKKSEEGKGALSVDWMNDFISRDPELQAKARERFGETASRDALIRALEADPAMKEELDRRVIERWESEEAAVCSGRSKY